jgi:hypothetical protein
MSQSMEVDKQAMMVTFPTTRRLGRLGLAPR